MSYESPIITSIYEQIANKISQDFDNRIIAAVNMNVDVHVDKEELIKALNYDREQYEKGYTDAWKECVRPQGKWVEGYHDYFETLDCSLCGYVRDNRHATFNFCPNCGADMRGDDT